MNRFCACLKARARDFIISKCYYVILTSGDINMRMFKKKINTILILFKMAEIHDQFREQETIEFHELQKELEATAKNCRILQYKQRKSDRRRGNLIIN